MAQLEQIATNLMKTCEHNTAVIKEAENQLEKLSQTENFASLILAIPQMEGVSPELSRVATIYMLTYARNLVLWRNQAMTNIAAQQMLDFVSKNSIDFKYKDQVGAALQYLIQKDQHNVIVYAFLSNMTQILHTALKSAPNQINFEFITIMSEALADKVVPATGQQAQKYIYESFICLSSLISKILGVANNFVSTDLSIVEKALLLSTKMLKTLKKYIKKFMYFNSKVTQTVHTPQFLALIKQVLNFNLPQNTLSLPIFYLNTNKQLSSKLLQYFHSIKSITIYILTQSLRVVIYSNNSSSQKVDAQIIAKCPQFITVFVDAVNGLLQKCPYYKLASKVKVKIIQQIYNFLIACLRCGKFYNALSQLRSTIIFSCIFKTLAFSPQDYENYYNDPQQFVNSLFQIVELDAGFLANNQKSDMDDEVLDIQIFDTLKTHSANLLKNYVKYIDGTTAEISFYLINVIDDKINLELSKNLMFLILCVLRDELQTRSDFLYKVKKVVFKNLSDLEVPLKSVEQPYSNTNGKFIDVEYSLTMFTLNQFLVLFNATIQDANSVDKAFQICEKLLKNDKVEAVPKIFAAELLFTIMDKTQQSTMYARRTIELLNQILSAKKLNVRYLQCILEIIKQNGAVFKKDYSMLIQMIQKISAFLVNQLCKQNKNVEITSMLWHIFQELATSKVLNGLLVDTLKRATQPLINLINGENQIQLQEKVYNLMEKIIKITGGIGQFQLQILSILPKTFYTGKKKRTLSSCFSLLQLIILYGKQGLTSNLMTTKNLIVLCLDGITSKSVNQVTRKETQCLQGIFIVQSLIISVGTHFTQEMWVTITTCLANKLRNELLIYDFVKASIISTLSLVISTASNCFSASDNQQLMKLILKNLSCLTFYEPMKLFIIAMSNLLQQTHLPFVSVRYPYLLDCTVTLLKQAIVIKPTSSSETEEMDSESKHYLKILKSVRNSQEGVDQFSCFKMAIMNIRDKNRDLLESALSELPAVKQTYFKDMLAMRKVGENPRVIYKVKNVPKSESTTM